MNSSFCSGNPLGYYAITKFNMANDDFCEIMARTKDLIYFPLNHIMFTLYLALLLTSLGVNVKEDFKWMIFNSTLLNFIFSSYTEVYIYFLRDKFELVDTSYIPNWIFHSYISDLSYLSGFPLALNRFVFVYFPKSYTKFFNKRNLITFIVLFDMLMLVFNFLTRFTLIYIVYLIFIITVQSFSIVFFFLISRKIRKDTKGLQKVAHVKTMRDYKRASIYCLVQGILSFIVLFISMYLSIFGSYYTIIHPRQSRSFFIDIYIFLAAMIETFYSISLIIECFLTIFLLRTYRIVIGNFFRVLRKMLFKKENIVVTPQFFPKTIEIVPN